MPVIEHSWMPLSDGRRLSARIFMPDGGAGRYPAVIEYSPYRCHDITRQRDSVVHGHFAAHGYVSIRVDIKGTGESDGVLTDEYDDQETSDFAEVVEFVARQPWCSGSVGAFGHSWGAYSALQVAMRRPRHLKAILPVMGSDDRAVECVHFDGGRLLNANFVWGSYMQIYASLPPNPAVIGQDWRERWQRRIEAQPLWASRWMRSPSNRYWSIGSVSSDYSSIQCPIYFFAGTADRYRDAPFRLFDNCPGLVKIALGPWDHCYPHEAAEPAIDFLGEAVRWWDHWLKGRDAGIWDEPRIHVWEANTLKQGRWFGTDKGLGHSTSKEAIRLLPAEDSHKPQNLFGSDVDWVVGRPGSGLLPMPRSKPVVLISEPLLHPLEVVGRPSLKFEGRICSPQIVARLFALHDQCEAVEIARSVAGPSGSNELIFHTIAHCFDAGSRLGVLLSAEFWPAVWMPASGDEELSLDSAFLEMPSRRQSAWRPAYFEAARSPVRSGVHVLEPGFKRVTTAAEHGRCEMNISSNAAFFGDFAKARLTDIDVELAHAVDTRFTLDDATASAEIRHTFAIAWPSSFVELDASFTITSKGPTHRLQGVLKARLDGRKICAKIWPVEDVRLE